MFKKLCLFLLGSLSFQLASAQCVASFTPSAVSICRNSSVTYMDLSSGATGVVTYSWNFGAGAVPATSTLQNPPAVTYTTAGVKTITLTYSGTGGGGCSVTATQDITVNAPPVANFTSNSPQCTGANVNFVNTGTVVGTTWAWSFGAGSSPGTSNTQTPTGITYSSSGNKTVSLTTTNPSTGCFATTTHVITINLTPVASFASTAPQCTGVGVNFTNTGTVGAGETYAWVFTGGAPAASATQNQAGVTYAAAGTQTVSLTNKITATGCKSTAIQTININQTPTASFTSTAPACTGAGVTFTNTGSAGANIVYSWNFGAGASPATSTAQNPSGITFSTAGAITVTETVTNTATGCSATTTNIITINQAPASTFTSTAPQCLGSNVDFTNTGSTGAGFTYAWNFGANGTPLTSTTQNQAGVTFSTSGAQTISLTTTNSASGCSSTTTQVININALPVASFTSTAPKCSGAAVTFTNTGSTGANINYNWSFGAGASPSTSTTQNPSGVTFSTSGALNVTLTITNSTTGCVASTTSAITINPTPLASFTSTAPACTGTGVSFTNTGTTGAGETYAWTFAGGVPAVSATQNQAGVTFAASGAKTITLTNKITATGCSSTATQVININQTPTANFTSNSPQCTGANVNFVNTGTVVGTTWAWSFGAGSSPSSSNAQTPAGIVYSTAGAKTVSLTTTNPSTGCFATVTHPVTINQTPAASFASTAPQCTGAGVDFTNTGTTGAGETYAWTFAGGVPAASATQNQAGVTYAAAGTQTVSLTNKITATGCQSTATQTIDIYQTPTASFTSTAPACTGTGVTFTNTGSAGANIVYSWNFGAGATPSTSTAQNPSGITFSTGGAITVTETVTNSLTGCSATSSNVITINQAPASTFTSTAPQCLGANVDFTNTGTTGAGETYAWNFGPNGTPLTSTTQNQAGVTFSTSGAQTISLTTTTTATGCSSTTTQVININALPVASFTSTAPACSGAAVNFTNTGSTGANIDYNWSFGAGASPATSTTQNPSGVTFSTSGALNVTLTVTNSTTGCTASTTSAITINPSPVATFSSTAPQCMGANVDFTGTGSSGAGFTYSWNFGPNGTPLTSTTQSQAGVTFSTSGAQTISYTITDAVS
ncbi:MAG TPA: PKD domain-containing protein, partial [Bacteroidia bacterium]|nr:PKD domain-containing protein [Bacteroidia bacterium]